MRGLGSFERRLDQLCDAFERAYLEGESPDLIEYLTKFPEDEREAALAELLQVELELRRKAGQKPVVDEYAVRFSDQRDLVRQVFELVESRDANTTLQPTRRQSRTIGPYKLLQKIGEGGMGEVWMAEQEQPVRRRVAIKLIRTGMDSDEVIARFEAERQALAMMNHQYIAKVLDAGQTDLGLPYFVMELVQGIPFTEYCDKNKLNLNERLQLFIPVCRAVQHAHQKGIIHRDLKPSNVLVTLYDGKPVPKVIDFGMAKALQHQIRLTDRTLFTEFRQVVGTVQYMSPEQAEMNALDVDTRSDIYSLGVMLYELLTGSTPLERETIQQHATLDLLRLIAQLEPPRPSTRLSQSGKAIDGISAQRRIDRDKLLQTLRGDLDWVVMKALEKDRARRYATAEAFAEDLESFLHDDPVAARPPSFSYSAHKAFRKHRPLVLTTLAIGILLVAGIAGTTWQAVRANRAEDTAWRNAKLEREAATLAQANEELAIRNAKLAAESEVLAQQRLTKMYIDRAARAYEDKDFDAGLLWANAAWNADPNATENERMHRLRLGWGLANQLELAGLVIGDAIDACDCDAKGEHLIIRSGGHASLWAFQTGELLSADLKHPDLVTDVTVSDDGRFSVTGCRDGVARVWDATSGRFLREVNHQRPIEAVEFQESSALFTTAGGGSPVCVWDAATGERLLFLKGADDATRAMLGTDGKRLLTISENGDFQFWNFQDGKPIGTEISTGRQRFNQDLYGNQFATTPNLDYLAFGPNPLEMRLPTGELMWKTQNEHHRPQAFNKTMSEVLVTSRAVLYEEETATSRVTSQFLNPRECQRAAYVSADRMVSSSTGGTILLWDLSTAASKRADRNDAVGIAQCFSDVTKLQPVDDDSLFFAQANALRLYRLGQPIRKVRGIDDIDKLTAICPNLDSNKPITWSPDLRYACAYTSSNQWKLIDLHEEESRTLAELPSGHAVSSFSKNSNIVTSTYTGGFAAFCIGDTLPPKMISLDLHSAVPLRLSSDGQRAAVQSSDLRQVAVVDTSTGEVLLKPEFEGVPDKYGSFVVVSGDGHTAAACPAKNSPILTWDVETGTQMARFDAHRGVLNDLDLSEDGRYLLVSSSDNTARLWYAQSGTPVGPPLRHDIYVRRGRIGPDNRTVVTCEESGRMIVWDAHTGDKIAGWPIGQFGEKGTPTLRGDWSGLSFRIASDVYSVEFMPLDVPQEHVSSLLDLLTAKGIDQRTQGITSLPEESVRKYADEYLAAWRAWRLSKSLANSSDSFEERAKAAQDSRTSFSPPISAPRRRSPKETENILAAANKAIQIWSPPSEPSSAVGLRFDGVDDVAVINNLHFDGEPPMTWEAIVQVDRFAPLARWTALLSASDGRGAGLEFENRRPQLQLAPPIGSLTAQRYARAADAVPLGRPVHIAGVWDGTKASLFIDGTIEAVRSDVLQKPQVNERLTTIGAFPAADGGWLTGIVEQVRISRSAEYTDDFRVPDTLTKTPGTQALFDFRRNTGEFAEDLSGNGHHAILVGATWEPASKTSEGKED